MSLHVDVKNYIKTQKHTDFFPTLPEFLRGHNTLSMVYTDARSEYMELQGKSPNQDKGPEGQAPEGQAPAAETEWRNCAH